MSIPKEPRQLMINLMYLVLTAMLALNVSAEIINAFFKLDKSSQKATTVMNQSSAATFKNMEGALETKRDYKPVVEAAKKAQAASGDLLSYISEVRGRLYEEAGGEYTAELVAEKNLNPILVGYPQDKKNKDIPQRLFVTGDYGPEGKKTPAGPVIKEKINQTLATYEQILDDLYKSGLPEFNEKRRPKAALWKELTSGFALEPITEEGKTKDGSDVWSDETFGHMPVAAVVPILSQWENSAASTQTAFTNFLSENMGKLVLKFDKFDAFVSAPKSYLLKGDKYEAEIALGAYSSQIQGFRVSVNGKSIPARDGKATYTASANKLGSNDLVATVSFTNPLTGKTESGKKKFGYEVGAPSAAISLDKMNVFYVGVENPLSVSVSGVSSNKVKVSDGGALGLRKSSGSSYVVKPTKPMKNATISVSGEGLKAPIKFSYRVKRIPDPVPFLGSPSNTKKKLGTGSFKTLARNGIIPVLKDFDFDARCQVKGYELVYVPKRQDVVSEKNPGSKPGGRAATLVSRAKPGDQYFFRDIKAKCPGDSATRNIGDLVFSIN